MITINRLKPIMFEIIVGYSWKYLLLKYKNCDKIMV